jgi:hypothetical protein
MRDSAQRLWNHNGGLTVLPQAAYGDPTMRRRWTMWILAIVMTAAFASDAAAKASRPPKEAIHHRHAAKLHGSYLRSLGPGAIGYPHRAHGGLRWRGTRFADLVGDPGSGLGFYPLPLHYRVGAWRYRLHHWRPPWQNPVLFAIMADATRYYYDWVPANQGYRYGVFDPIEGVGTPFFGGYYAAGDGD